MRVELYGNLGGWHGTDRTIRKMQKLVASGKVDPTIIFTAQQLARKSDPKDFSRQASDIYKFVKSFIHYVKDPRGVELLRSPFWSLYYRAGDCDDQAILFCALAEAIGFKTRFKAIKADPREPTEYSHVYSQIEVPGKGWLSADTIVKKAKLGWETPAGFASHVWGDGGGWLGMFGQEQATPRLQLTRKLIGTCVAPLKDKYPPAMLRRAVIAVAQKQGKLGGVGMTLGQAQAAVKELTPWQKFLAGAGTALSNAGVQAANILATHGANQLSSSLDMPQTLAPAAGPPAKVSTPIWTWLVPVLVVGAAGAGAITLAVVKRRKR